MCVFLPTELNVLFILPDRVELGLSEYMEYITRTLTALNIYVSYVDTNTNYNDLLVNESKYELCDFIFLVVKFVCSCSFVKS